MSDKVPRRIEMPKVENKIIEVFSPEQVKAMLLACGQEYNDHVCRELSQRGWGYLPSLLANGAYER